jgi:ubiquinone/menaquinone biosynthesis C-methylase UbiE
MNICEQALGHIVGGLVLDIATGRGSFIGTLKRFLQSYTEIAGIDISEAFLKDAQNNYGEENIHFSRVDAEHLSFRDESFHTVSAAKSLHHWANVSQVLSEMKRVLKPEGHIIVSDMHREVQTEAQRTDMYIHHFGAKVHRMCGFTHNKTFTRQEIVDSVMDLGFCKVLSYDWSDTSSDPMDTENVREKEEVIDRILQFAQEMPNYEAIERQGEQLRQRLYKVGIQSEPVVVVVGKKLQKG